MPSNDIKRPMPVYTRWFNQSRQSIIDEHFTDDNGLCTLSGCTKVTKISKKAGEIWRGMSEAEKAPYKQAYDEDNKAYLKSVNLVPKSFNKLNGWSEPIPNSYIPKYVVKGLWNPNPHGGFDTFGEARRAAEQIGPRKCGGITQYGPEHPKWAGRYTLRRAGTGTYKHKASAIQEKPWVEAEQSWVFMGKPLIETIDDRLHRLERENQEMRDELKFLRIKVSPKEQREHWIKKNDWMSQEDYDRKMEYALKNSPEEVARLKTKHMSQPLLPDYLQPITPPRSDSSWWEFHDGNDYIVDDDNIAYDWNDDGEVWIMGKYIDGEIVPKWAKGYK